MPKKAPTPPPAEVIEQIQREVTAPGFLADLSKWADRQCGRLMSIENRVDPHKATELLHGAVVDTCDGIRNWDPTARSLRRHLEQVINSRMWHECDRARRRRHIPLDSFSVDDSQDETSVAVEMSLRQEDIRMRPDGRVALREVRTRLFREMRLHAGTDAEVVALLDAYEDGHVRRDEAMHRLGWRLGTFVNVRRRLETVLRHVSEDVRGAAVDALTIDGGAIPIGVARKGDHLAEIAADGQVADESLDEVASASGDGDCEEQGAQNASDS